jgi:hypothetical protein
MVGLFRPQAGFWLESGQILFRQTGCAGQLGQTLRQR